jgi:succinoglycan biosynthesis transport protein ExoP
MTQDRRDRAGGAAKGRLSAGKSQGLVASPERSSAGRRSDGRLSRSARRVGRERSVAGGTRGFIVTRIRWIVAVTMVAIGAAAFVSWSETPTYSSAAEVLVQPRVFTPGTAPQAPDMGTEKAVATSDAVLLRASRLIGVPVAQLSHGLSVSVPLNTNTLRIAYSSTDPARSQRRAQAVADAYTAYWLAEQPSPRTSPRTAGGDLVGSSVISDATRPSAPSSPNHMVDLIVATVIGLMVAAGTAFIRDRFDDRLRAPNEFDEFGAGPVLAVIPAVRHRGGDARNRLVMARSPESGAAHAYQDLRTLVFRAAAQRYAKTLLVTSPAGDRQTLVAANLAIALATAGQRTILVCADLRWPHGHELFGEFNAGGLASVVEGRGSVADALRPTDVKGLQVLPAGSLEGDYGAALHSPALRQAMRRLSAAADFVVIDAPPALAGADTGALAELVEMILLVGDARRTTRRQVSATVDQLRHVSAQIIGSVVDNFGRRTRPISQPLTPLPDREDFADPKVHSNGHRDADWLMDAVGVEEANKR